VNYLLNTNVCIAPINGTSSQVRRRYIHATNRPAIPSTYSIVAHELRYGVAKSGRVPQNANRLATFLNSAVDVPDYSAQDARAAGAIRAAIEQQGQRIGEYDTLIAGQAFSRNLALVTANTREFASVNGLIVEDWTR
jgi:tRNA(fMet)-specific endonuclease VapC